MKKEKRKLIFELAGTFLGVVLAGGIMAGPINRSHCIGRIYREAATNTTLSPAEKDNLLQRAELLERERSFVLDPAYIPFYGLITDRYTFNPK